MKFDLKTIPSKLSPIFQKIREYGSFILVLFILTGFAFIVLRIRYYVNMQPSESNVNEKLQALESTHIDQDVIEKIEQLESTNVDVKALFDKARNNPFKE